MIYRQRTRESTTPRDAIASPSRGGGILHEFLVAARFHTASVEVGGWFSAADQTLAVPPETGPAQGLFAVERRLCGLSLPDSCHEPTARAGVREGAGVLTIGQHWKLAPVI